MDFTLRFLGGANISVFGAAAQLIVAIREQFGSKPRWIAGPPKQFASFCGVMFAFLAFLFYQVAGLLCYCCMLLRAAACLLPLRLLATGGSLAAGMHGPAAGLSPWYQPGLIVQPIARPIDPSNRL